jgi:hypothetical protein
LHTILLDRLLLGGFSKFEALDLAGSGFGKFRDKLDPARIFKRCKPIFDEGF